MQRKSILEMSSPSELDQRGRHRRENHPKFNVSETLPPTWVSITKVALARNLSLSLAEEHPKPAYGDSS